MDDVVRLKLLLGICLVAAGALMFSIWQERLAKLPQEERTHFLMYQWLGGAWIVALFSACGGAYFIASSILRLS